MRLLARAVAISVLAGTLAALPYAVLFSIGMDFHSVATAVLRFLAFGVIASLVVGLPMALLVIKLVRSDDSFGRAEVFLTANGVAIILAAILALIDGWFSVIFLGLPILLAANFYAIAGWRFILREFRDNHIA